MVKTKCIKSCFSAGRVWNLGDPRNFIDEKSIHPHFKKIDELKKKKSLKEMSFDELRDYAAEKKIVLPSDTVTSSAILAFINAVDGGNEGFEEGGEDPAGKTKPFSQLTVEEYKDLAAKEEIEIPKEISTRAELKDFLGKALKEKEAAQE